MKSKFLSCVLIMGLVLGAVSSFAATKWPSEALIGDTVNCYVARIDSSYTRTGVTYDTVMLQYVVVLVRPQALQMRQSTYLAFRNAVSPFAGAQPMDSVMSAYKMPLPTKPTTSEEKNGKPMGKKAGGKRDNEAAPAGKGKEEKRDPSGPGQAEEGKL